MIGFKTKGTTMLASFARAIVLGSVANDSRIVRAIAVEKVVAIVVGFAVVMSS